MTLKAHRLSLHGVWIILLILLVPKKGQSALLSSNLVIDENSELQQEPVPLTFIEAIKLMEKEKKMSKDTEESSRMITITDGGVYRGDLVFYLPITILLPTLAYGSRYSSLGRSYSSQGKRHSTWYEDILQRVFLQSNSYSPINDVRGSRDKVMPGVAYDPTLSDYQIHKDFGPLLSRIDAYFHYLGVEDEECRMKALCQLMQSPATYTPVAQLFLAALRKSESFTRPKSYMKPVLRFYKYYWAAEIGGSSKDAECLHKYSECPADISDVINMNILKLWQKISAYLSIKLSDE